MDTTSDLVNYLIDRAIQRYYVTPIRYYHTAKRAKASKDSEPTTFKQALNHPQKHHWLPAFFKELQQLLTTQTFYFINRLKA